MTYVGSVLSDSESKLESSGYVTSEHATCVSPDIGLQDMQIRTTSEWRAASRTNAHLIPPKLYLQGEGWVRM